MDANGNVPSKGQTQLNFGGYELAGEMLKFPPKLADSIVPVTPDLKQEIGESALDLNSPLSCLSKALCFSSQDDMLDPKSPRTPKESVFDPFAPGPDRLLLAPLCPKYTSDSRTVVARMLNFDECSDHDANADAVSEDEAMLGKLYRMLLQVVIAKHTEEVLAGISKKLFAATAASGCDGDRTPPSAPRFTGIAETCPAAPKKAARKLIGIDKGLCKKLEF